MGGHAYETHGSFRFSFLVFFVPPGGTAAAVPGLLRSGRCAGRLSPLKVGFLESSQDTRHNLAVSEVCVVSFCAELHVLRCFMTIQGLACSVRFSKATHFVDSIFQSSVSAVAGCLRQLLGVLMFASLRSISVPLRGELVR